MKLFIVLSALVAVGLAKPSGLVAPLAYAKLIPGAPIGLDGRVVDTPEVSYAKAEHAAAHINEKLNLANEAVKSADYIAYAAAPAVAAAPVVASETPVVASAAPVVATSYAAAPAVALPKYTGSGAPIGLDGRVVDTPEVAYAKAEHAAAHINHKIDQSYEALKSANLISYAAAPVVATSYAAAPVVATSYAAAPAVATTYAAAPVVATPYAAAPVVATSYAATAPVVATSYAAAPAVQLTKYTGGGAPIGLDGRVVDTPEVAYAKAEHAAARINEGIDQGRELLRNSPVLLSSGWASPVYATGYIQHY